jgi:hypothetical protein
MSRGYRIQMEPLQTVRGTVTGSDQLQVGLDLLPILNEGDMREIVRDALKEKGWKEGPDGTMEKDLGEGATAVLDKEGKTVTVRLATQQKIEGAGRTAEEAEKAMEARRDAAEKDAQTRATKLLARLEPEVRAELDSAMQKVYVEALKKKAQQMGQVESLQETKGADGSIEITIKVKA